MDPERFEKLAAELAAEQRELPASLASLRENAEALRRVADAAVHAFVHRAAELGAEQLLDLEVSQVGPDEKHVDCLQFELRRGRWRLVCVLVAAGAGKLRLVGPFPRGKSEGPCSDYTTSGAEVESALQDRIESLIRKACSA